MKLSPTLRTELSLRAETVPQRIARDRRHAGDADSVDQWASVYGEELFESRLDWFGIDRDRAETLFGTVEPDGVDADPWTNRLSELLDVLADTDVNSLPESDVPFGDVLEPVVDRAIDSVATTLKQRGQWFTTVAEGFCQLLRHRLSKLLAQALHVEYRVFCAETRGESDPELVASRSDGNREAYEAFLQRLLNGRFVKFFRTYSVAGRRLVDTVDNWKETVTEFCRRYDNDRETIGERITGNPTLREVVPGLGDTHEGGRTVVACTFSDDSVWYYKPRPPEPETIVGAVFEWANTTTVDAPVILNRGEYSWSAAIPHTEVDSGKQDRYYRRAGRLAAVSYLLRCGDLHYENVVAHGATPRVIDWEVVADVDGFARRLPAAEAERRLELLAFNDSIFSTGLFPCDTDSNRSVPDISAFGHLEPKPGTDGYPTWTEVNRDGMRFERTEGVFDTATNVPQVDGETVPPDEHLQSITAGFRETYWELSNRSDSLLALLRAEGLDEAKTRFLVRPTQQYQSTRRRLNEPAALRDGPSAWFRIEQLFAGYDVVDSDAYDQLWPIFDAESRALLGGDVPRFTLEHGSLSRCHREVVAEFAEKSKTERVADRLETSGPQDCLRQEAYIAASLERLDTGPEYHGDV